MSYNNVLILEDDFIFVPKIKENNITSYLNTFLKSKEDTNFIYLLGIFPLVIVPYDLYSYRVFVHGAMHAYITSRKYRDIILSNKKDFIEAIYFERYINSHTYAYTYKEYLCVQYVINTENSNNWGRSDKGFSFMDILYLIDKKYIKITNLANQIEPGYSILYYTTKILFWFIIFLIIFISNKIINKIKKK